MFPNLKLGMQVRFPVDTSENDSHFRNFRLGRILEIDNLADTCQIECLDTEINRHEISFSLLRHCFILPDTQAIHLPTSQKIRVLIAVEEEPDPNDYWHYYVLLNGQVRQVNEAELQVFANRQDPNPLQQLIGYEFHNPFWRYHRDRFVKAYQDLQNATSGLGELVSTRVLLLAHQAEVISQVLSDETCRYILADEVGLGKTIEASVILKGLLERYGQFKTLIVTPAPLYRQWYNELNDKFWLQMTTWKLLTKFGASFDEPGMIVSTEQLDSDNGLWEFVQSQNWGLIIVDEAHQTHRHPQLYERLLDLSIKAERVLLLSATPILHRSREFLDLLRLMHPQRYQALSDESFERIVANQKSLLNTITYLRDSLKPAYFENDEFVGMMAKLKDILPHDDSFAQQLNLVAEQQTSPDEGLGSAQSLISYITENYRIENRMKRNRRINIASSLLPERQINLDYVYEPSEIEKSCIAELLLYVQASLAEHTSAGLEFSRLLVHATFSSPEALCQLVDIRLDAQKQPTQTLSSYWLYPGSPRLEEERFNNLASAFPFLNDEVRLLRNIQDYAKRWSDESKIQYQTLPSNYLITDSSYRLLQVLRAIQTILAKDKKSKLVVFSSWQATVNELVALLRRYIGKNHLAEFHIGINSDSLQLEADRFQNDSECRVMICDELGGEGRNFQIADAIIHVDLPWTPARIEQRIGRVDRLGREGIVLSIVPFAKQELEEDLFQLYQDSFSLFTQSMSGLEIVLESVQDEILRAFQENPYHGLKALVPRLKSQTANLRTEIERERIFDEGMINHQQRAEFERIAKDYEDGHELRKSISAWSNVAGIEHYYDATSDTVSFQPKKFNLKKMQNAKIFNFPNMEDVLRRSGRTHNLIIRGSFNRKIAVRREDIVFFAPRGDAWTSMIITNALEADRGRCAAVELRVGEIQDKWQGLEFFFSVQVDPRPLYALELPPIHLYKARGYLSISSYSLFLSLDGKILKASSPIVKAIQARAEKINQRHLGERGNGSIEQYIAEYPPEEWRSVCETLSTQAWEIMRSEFAMEGEAEEAAEYFAQKARGFNALTTWLEQHGLPNDNTYEHYHDISEALCKGIQNPLIRLESIGFWKVNTDVG